MRKEKYANSRLDSIIEELERISKEVSLAQNTEDIHQLNPVERLRSIEKVWVACSELVGNPHTAVDAGAGFGYGTVFLETLGIHTIGIENVETKIDQGIELFKKVGIDIELSEKIDCSKTPALVHADFTEIPEEAPQVDLISMFYLSGKMIADRKVFEVARRLLRKGGKLLLSTEASRKEVEMWVDQNPIPSSSIRIVDIPGNFEQTAIIIGFV